ncbi:hypothetical protein EAY71_17095 [Vibrio anguillarum]|uniref:Uncharacterized protein n=4 Tax=root TaxID=1 RepID=A0A3G1SVM7_9VIRU|nr:hypothetical protein [Vibrio anguillarum]AXU40241.1 hypothetical protein fNo16_0012 [Vibrio phage fNo16]QYS24680.1 hypothetical protein fNO16VIB134_0012 [Vibrio phage NO16-like VIB134]QYS24703.1 hypothetical protein fNO16VIB93_0012 [Vibrio phage NO16-like VIB93]QYS24726.1 hypothetical protein fNO16VIB88_0012 [Vibrio phage NO16-like VIB88]QYS24749.1 hypothetical protein fNO16VIB1_0012 [Vibrio phage NO16-like VIB1]QYS24772.1 hypothetical protein fNO16NB10_0012 [Vibrio phage NO16-like NB10]Q
MKYANQEKSAVITTDKNGNIWTVPRGHRFWVEFGIDKAEQEGRIDEPETLAIDGGDNGSGSAVN